MIINSVSIDAINKAVVKSFEDALNKQPIAADQITNVIPVNQPSVLFPFLHPVGKLREWKDAKILNNLVLEKISVEIKDWEGSVKIPRNAIKDDTFGLYGDVGGKLAKSAALHKQNRIVYALQNGTSATLFPNFDGLATFSTAHTLNPDGNQSNNFTSTALSATNFASVRASMEAYLGPDGSAIGVSPTHLVVPPQLRATGEAILEAQFNANGASNTNYQSMTLVVLPELANQGTTWYMLDANMGALNYLEREAPMIVSQVDPTDERCFTFNEYVYSVESRGEAQFGPWFGIARAIA